ncbi:MAG: ABC transporter ATP-binding protein [Alphaproteobacteria bacterium]
MSDVKLSGIRKSFGAVEVIKGVDLQMNPGEFVVFVGPSGCGKTTLLRLIAGLEEITSGELRIDDELMNETPPAQRGIAMVFQSYALYPHMNVFNNMAFGMKLAKVSKAEISERVNEAANILQLTEFLDRLPKQLSGGQRQRVAIGRAIVRNPQVFLFDEPLSNLDAALRVATRIEIAKLHETMPDTTMVYVTHDQVEAMTLADRIVVLNSGIIEQVGPPMDLYQHPANLFVARFIGSPAMNISPCRIDAAAPKSRITPAHGNPVNLTVEIPADSVGSVGTLGVRPEDMRLGDEATALFSGEVELVEALGEVTLVYASCGGDEPVLAKLDGYVPLRRGNRIHLTTDPKNLHVFGADGRAFTRHWEVPEAA